MDRREALVALNMFTEIGSVRLEMLLKYFDKPQDIFSASRDRLAELVGAKTASRIKSLREGDLSKEFSSAGRSNIRIVTIEDSCYPENLRSIPSAPLVLYVKGRLCQDDAYGIAIVGSRRASFYGLSTSRKLAFELAGKGFTVVSGMARGIDTCAHRGALKASGRTIAVMGSGFNQVYPRENRGLAEEIACNGAVISEFSMDTNPLRQNFPRRNRLISGLSLGVVVVEAAKNSGALITADFALEQGREVFAVPGEIDASSSFGTLSLIKEGAKLVSDSIDVIEELALPVRQRLGRGSAPAAAKNNALDIKENSLYNLLSCSPLHLDEIAQRAHIGIAEASGLLLGMQLKRIIKELPGKHFIRNG